MTESENGHFNQRRASLRAMAEAQLARRMLPLTFPPALQQRFHSDRAKTRSSELQRLAKFGPFGYFVAILFIHVFVDPNASAAAFLTQLLAIPPVIYVVAFRFARPETPPLQREGMVLGLCCLVVMGVSFDVATSPPDLARLIMFLMSATVTGCMFFTRMSPVQAALFIVFSAACLAAVSLGRSDIASAGPLFPLASLLVSATFALFALRELDEALRRNYLLGLLQIFRIEDLADENQTLDLLATTDALTGTDNRRGFEKLLAKLERSTAESCFLLLVDVDHFKQINDRFGHPTGDAALREAAAAIREALGPSYRLARIGGDEFAALINDCSPLEAYRIAERVCERVREKGFQIDGRRHPLSVTIGAAQGDEAFDARQFVAAADAALYRAKRNGRGQVVWASSDDKGHASGLAA